MYVYVYNVYIYTYICIYIYIERERERDNVTKRLSMRDPTYKSGHPLEGTSSNRMQDPNIEAPTKTTMGKDKDHRT